MANESDEVCKLTKLRESVFGGVITDDTWLDVVDAIDELIRIKRMSLLDRAREIHKSITDDGECWGDTECPWCKHKESCRAANALCTAISEELKEANNG